VRRTVFVLLAACGTASLESCANAKTDLAPDATVTVSSAASDASDDANAASPLKGVDKGNQSKLAATNFQVSVVDLPSWPETGAGARRLGYLRAGAMVMAYDRPVPNDDCREGWIELAEGGYVCAKAITFDLKDARVRLAPKQPDREAGMPYRYGVNISDGTPLYRRVLAAEDRKKYEHHVAGAASSSSATTKPQAHAENEGASAAESADKASEEAAPPEEEQPTPSPRARKHEGRAADAGTDVGKPKLRDYRGRGVLVRKMGRGFYVALDREFKAAGAKWWRTTFGFAAPHDKILVQSGVTKHAGTWFGKEPFWMPDADGGAITDAGESTNMAGVVGFITNEGAHELTLSEDGTKMGRGTKELPRRSAVMLTGKEIVIGGVRYHQSANGFWIQLSQLKLAKPAPPSDLAHNEKWIDVDLTRQTLVAFEGTRPVFGTLVSSGRRNLQDKEKDFPTPTGTFHVKEKHVTTTMDGDVAADGPYSIEDVPWVMYFQGSYALHGAFWHDQFGNLRSHGCVNLAPEDARTVFAWSEPQLPLNWHGVFAADDKPGTRIVIHEDQPAKRR